MPSIAQAAALLRGAGSLTASRAEGRWQEVPAGFPRGRQRAGQGPPERDKALRLAAGASVPGGRPVILTVHELGQLARSSAELMTLAAALEADGIRLEVLTGPLAGTWDPRGEGSLLFSVLAAAAGLDRSHRREKSVEGQLAAAALAMRDQRMSVPEIAVSRSSPKARTPGSIPRPPRSTGPSPTRTRARTPQPPPRLR